MSFRSGNRASRSFHEYDHVHSYDIGEESSYSLDHFDAVDRHAESTSRAQLPGASELDTSDHIAYDVYHPYDTYRAGHEPEHKYPQQALPKQDVGDFPHQTILRKPLATASVNLTSEDASLIGRGQRMSKQRSQKSLVKIWWFESVCCTLVPLSVLAMVATMYAYDNKPLPSWKYGISISSLLAIYAIIFRVSAGYILSEGLGQLKWTLFRSVRPLHDLHIYDESARGPLGCIQLLSSFRGAQVAARLGAFATLTLLILDPFTQQLLGYRSCNVPATPSNTQDLNASVPLLPRTSAFYGNGTYLYTGWTWPEPDMQAIANAGLYGVNATQVTPICKTGNCTFSSSSLFKTVGYCHQCHDVSSQLTIVRNTSTITTGPELNGDGKNHTDLYTTTTITLQQPGAGNFTNTLSVNSTMAGNAMVSGVFRPDTNSVLLHQNYSYTFVIPGVDADSNVWAFSSGNTRAIQCNLQMCVRTMNASIAYGKLHEETVAKYTNWADVSAMGNFSRSMIDLSQLDDKQKSFLADNGYRFTSNDIMIPYNGSLRPDGVVVAGNQDASSTLPAPEDVSNQFLSKIPASAIYTMSAFYSDGLQQFFKQLFVGQLVGPHSESSDRGSAPLTNLYYRGATLDTFNEAMSNIADSVTSFMRQTKVANFSAPVTGVENITTTCIEPRWPWLAYVVAVAIMVVGFFIMMLLETGFGQVNERHDFKSSGLATTCAGIDEQVRYNLIDALQSGDSDRLQAAARQIPVRLARDEVKFIHQD